MSLSHHGKVVVGRFRVHVITDRSHSSRLQYQQQLLTNGLPLPLAHRAEWAQSHPAAASWFFAVHDTDDQCKYGMAAAVHRTRALPGHFLLRVERFGSAGTQDEVEGALSALAQFARRQRRVLRVHLEVYSRDPLRRRHIAACASRMGFRRSSSDRCYVETVTMSLDRQESEIFAGLHKTARQNIRAISKHPVAVRPIDDPVHADRMQTLIEDTMARTEQRASEGDWGRVIEFSRAHPTLSRLAGLFRTDGEGPDSLLAFAWGCHHGDHAHYAVAASTRDRALRISYGYGPLWDLVLWAKSSGATWFDFGGITSRDTTGERDALAGISDFKRYFSRDILRVGEEWILELHPMRSAVARFMGSAVAALRGRR